MIVGPVAGWTPAVVIYRLGQTRRTRSWQHRSKIFNDGLIPPKPACVLHSYSPFSSTSFRKVALIEDLILTLCLKKALPVQKVVKKASFLKDSTDTMSAPQFLVSRSAIKPYCVHHGARDLLTLFWRPGVPLRSPERYPPSPCLY